MPARLRLLPCFLLLLAGPLGAQNTALRIEQTVEPRFPGSLTLSTITSGEARVVINVDADGSLVDLLVSGYTDQAFADEAVRVLRQWHYAPATQQGVPVGVRIEVRIAFSTIGRVISISALDMPDVLTRRFVPPSLVTRVCQPRDLDRPVTLEQSVTPPNPGQAGPVPTAPRTVLVDFYIDETGRPRMPVALSFPHLAYAQAAVGALSRWRFNAPTRAGKPVAVRVQQEFVFPANS